MNIQQFAARYGTHGVTTLVNRILSNLEHGETTHPVIIQEARSMMNDLRVALTNEVYNQRKD